MGWESFDVVTFSHGPLLQDQMRTAKLKSAYKLLIIGAKLQEIMGWESSDVFRFDLGPSLKIK